MAIPSHPPIQTHGCILSRGGCVQRFLNYEANCLSAVPSIKATGLTLDFIAQWLRAVRSILSFCVKNKQLLAYTPMGLAILKNIVTNLQLVFYLPEELSWK